MRTLIISWVLILGFTSHCFAQQEGGHSIEDKLEVFKDLFLAEEPLYLTLKFDVRAFKEARHEDGYHDAVMTNLLSEDFNLSDSVKLSAGGTFRMDHCALPPICLNLGHSGINADSPRDAIRMQMVVPCRSAGQYEPYVLREYLAYKIYNIITPLSYRVRLVRLTIIDTGKGNKMTENWAFLQEPDELLSQRLDAKMLKRDDLSMSQMNPDLMNSLSLFQYMIGNGNYSVTGRFNLKILAVNSGNPSGFLPVPCNFDFSGLVNAHYAVPGEALGTKSVRERYYLGPCHQEELQEEAIQELAQSYLAIMDYIKNFEYLDEKEKVDVMAYLDSYFTESTESGFIDRQIASTCR